MAKELLVNVSRGEEVRVALVEDARLEEIYLERDSAASNVGNIYLGKVTNVEGSIQAAFVDFGYGRNGFLHVQDLHPDYFPEGGRWERMQERVGKKIGRRDRPPIQECLRRGDRIVVQIIKEGIGTKGPTLTSYPSVPGRFLVMMPGVAQMGVSKNIEDEEERRRLRKILDGLKPPKDVGFIIRTAGMGKSKSELERDFKYLTRLHEQIEQHRKNAQPPTLLYSEGDLVTRTVRDVWSSDVDRVVCDDPETALRIKQFFKLLMPRTKVDVQLYQGSVPLFHAAGIEQEIETMFSRHVPLPSGGSLVIESTEAAVTIDVNSGKFREHDDAEETAFRTDMEAADEICRQLRLRDLGGVVLVDFIDLRYSRHRQSLHDRLMELFKRDRAKSRHLPMNEFGLVAITRQRMRPDLKKSVFMSCPWSRGTGYIKTPESMALDVMRRLRVAAADERVRTINVRLYPTAALHVLNTKRQALADLERQSESTITLRQDETLAADDVVLELLDERDGQVQVEALLPAAGTAVTSEDGARRRRRRRRRPEPQPQAGAIETGPAQKGALIDLPDLLELGELKLEEVEKLVNELGAGETAAREAAKKDPQKIILEALRSGALFEEGTEEEEGLSAGAPAGPPPADGELARADRDGHRRRRRGRGRDQERSAPPSPDRAAQSLDADAGPADTQKLGFEQEETAESGAKADQAGMASIAAGEQHGGPGEGGRRRRRRRGRRGHGHGERVVTTNGQPAELTDGQPQMPDEILDQQINGNRADLETHVMVRPAFPDDRRGPYPGRTEEAGGRRRRRRKGRGLRGQLIAGNVGGGYGGPGDASPAARLNGSRTDRSHDLRRAPLPGPGPLTANVTAVFPQATAPTAEQAGGRRRRRRRRRRGQGGGEGTVGSAGASLERGEGPIPGISQADPVEPVFFERDDSVQFLEPPVEVVALPFADEPGASEVEDPEPPEPAGDPPAVKKPSRRGPRKSPKTARPTSAKGTRGKRAGSPGNRG